MTIADTEVEILLRTTEDGTGQAVNAAQIPFIETINLEQVRVRLQSEPNTRPQELNVSHLRVVAADNGSLKLNGLASLNNNGSGFTASLGSIEQFFHLTEAFPVVLDFRVPALELTGRISGTLDDPLHGLGAELEIHSITSNISLLHKLFYPVLPFGGSADMNAHLSGDLHTASLYNLNLSIDDRQRLR